MSKYTKEDIFRMVEEEDIEFVRLQFSDIFGMPKNLAITSGQLERALNGECTFDASLVDGFRDQAGELYLKPDINTFTVFPWRPQTGKVARMYCAIEHADGESFSGDSRKILQNQIRKAKAMGLSFEIKPELEFFLFHTDDSGLPTTYTHESAGYFDMAPLDLAENVRRDIILTLEEMGFEVTGSHHEIAPAQHEIDFAEGRADKVADEVTTYKMAVKTIAKKHGMYATFMPKPNEGVNGSGMHVSVVCRDALGKNLFAAENEQEIMSDLAKHFAAGVLAHSKAITLITNPIVNSYKRLIPGYDAPTNIAWTDNRSRRADVIHVSHRNPDSTCIEYRSPDGVCNPYLAFALILAAGMDGIRRNLELQEMDRGEGMTRRELKNMHQETLPETLGEAMECYERDSLVREVLGDFIFTQFKDAKSREWREFRAVVTNWELEKYLGKY